MYYIQIDPQDYDEWRFTPPEEEIHFSGPNDEDGYQNLSSDDNQVIQQENFCSEPPEPLSYSLFQSHFQGSSTSNTQKIFLPKPTWEKPSKDQQQMIIDHKPNSGSPHLSTPNKSPSPFPDLPAPQQTAKPQQVHTHQSDESTTGAIKTETTPSAPLLAMAQQSINTSDDAASDISNVLSVKRSSQIQVCQCYQFQHANHTNQQLVDHGAYGGLAVGSIKIQDIDNHEVTGHDVVTAATLLNTPQGKVIGIFNEYAYLWKGSSIHSSGQLEWLQTNVHETSVKVGGTQLINTLDGYSVPLLIKDGLAMPPPLEDSQIWTWTHIHMSSSHLLMNGTPQSLTMILHTLMDWTPVKSLTNFLEAPCLMLVVVSISISLPTSTPSWMHLQEIVGHTQIPLLFSQPISIRVHPQEPDWNTQRPFLAWASPSSIKDTFNVITRHGIAPDTQDYINKHFKSRNPVFSIPRCSEAVATDTFFSDTPAVDGGPTMAQFFCGYDTFVCDVYGIKSTIQFINTLSDNIRKWGAMDTHISDGGKYEISKGVTDLLHSLSIQDYQNEPYHQDQNKAENCFGPAKRYTNTVMNTSGCPACCWLLCLQFICVLLHRLASPTLQGICPLQAL